VILLSILSIFDLPYKNMEFIDYAILITACTCIISSIVLFFI